MGGKDMNKFRSCCSFPDSSQPRPQNHPPPAPHRPPQSSSFPRAAMLDGSATYIQIKLKSYYEQKLVGFRLFYQLVITKGYRVRATTIVG